MSENLLSTAAAALLVKRCTACSSLFGPLATMCAACGCVDLTAVPSSGTGAIVSWKAAPGRAPAANAIVALDDGPLVYTWIEGEIPDRREVRVHFRPTPAGDPFPVFSVSAEPSAGPDAR